ncbi:MAG: hypothetical protein KAR80_00740, partial [Rhodospirillaceae bacterium]|nr:hypothetical protein [Rhodospirillaceae bacterium]
ILDALKKSDQERKRGEVPTITSDGGETESDDGGPKKIGLKIVAGGFALATVVLAGILLSGDDEPPAPSAPTDVAMTPSTSEQGPEPKPEPKSEPKIEQKPETASEPTKTKNASVATIEKTVKPKAPQPIIAATPTDADIPTPQPSATEASPPASQPVDGVAKAPAPEKIPGSTIAVAPAPAAKIKTASAPIRKKPKSNLPKLKQASDYLDRGWSSMDRGLYNQAVADFSGAVEMEPGFADGWFALGWAQEKNEQDSDAIASYTRAIKAKPNHTGALFSRAYLELFSGNASAATRDFTSTINLAEGDLKIYTHIWLFIARSNAGMDAVGKLAIDSRGDDLSLWPGPMVRFYAGNLSEAQILQSIESGNSSDLQKR